ncbi:unnamed protein product, partial [Laminaria digitata]
SEKHEQASKYWSFRLAVDHGFIDTKFPSDACIHPPDVDWMEPITASASTSTSSSDEEDNSADKQEGSAADVAGARVGEGGGEGG